MALVYCYIMGDNELYNKCISNFFFGVIHPFKGQPIWIFPFIFLNVHTKVYQKQKLQPLSLTIN